MSTSLVQQRNALSEAKRKLLEGYLKGQFTDAGKNVVRINCRPTADSAPLSLAQEKIWRREKMLAGRFLPHNECVTLKPDKWLDPDILERSFSEIISRHEIWRTNYRIVNDQPVQVVRQPVNGFPLQVVDLRAVSEATQEVELAKLYSEGAKRPFDLENGPLLRATLVTRSRDQRILVFAHLSIVDGVSVYQILPAELSSLCDAFSAGKPSQLEQLPIQYADYAYWQRQWLSSHELTEQLTYWQKQYPGDLPAFRWPGVHSRCAVHTHRGAVRSFALRRTLRNMVKQFSQHEGVTLFTTLAASLGTLLYCYTHQTNIVIDTPSLGARKRSEFHTLLGHFLNPVSLRINLEKDPSFRELLLRTQAVVGDALAYDEVPAEIIARHAPQGSASRNPFVTVAISLQPQTSEGAGWHVTSMDADSGGTIWDLYLAFVETPEGLVGRVQYSTDVFETNTLTRILDDLQLLMECVTADPEQHISRLVFQLPVREVGS